MRENAESDLCSGECDPVYGTSTVSNVRNEKSAKCVTRALWDGGAGRSGSKGGGNVDNSSSTKHALDSLDTHANSIAVLLPTTTTNAVPTTANRA